MLVLQVRCTGSDGGWVAGVLKIRLGIRWHRWRRDPRAGVAGVLEVKVGMHWQSCVRTFMVPACTVPCDHLFNAGILKFM